MCWHLNKRTQEVSVADTWPTFCRTMVQNRKKHRINNHLIILWGSEQCERLSEWTTEWFSTLICILGYSGPQCLCRPASKVTFDLLFWSRRNQRREFVPGQTDPRLRPIWKWLFDKDWMSGWSFHPSACAASCHGNSCDPGSRKEGNGDDSVSVRASTARHFMLRPFLSRLTFTKRQVKGQVITVLKGMAFILTFHTRHAQCAPPVRTCHLSVSLTFFHVSK